MVAWFSSQGSSPAGSAVESPVHHPADFRRWSISQVSARPNLSEANVIYRFVHAHRHTQPPDFLLEIGRILYPYAPWCWNIYLHLPHKWPSFVGKYASTMEHMGCTKIHSWRWHWHWLCYGTTSTLDPCTALLVVTIRVGIRELFLNTTKLKSWTTMGG